MTLPEHVFIPEITRQTRAFDTYGVNENLSQAELLADYVVTKEQRREMPIIGDPDEELIARLKAFYSAIAMRIEQETGLMSAPVFSLSHEGFGRVMITTGKLLVIDRALRDIHRFGFETLDKMCTQADKLLSQALRNIEKHPEAARD